MRKLSILYIFGVIFSLCSCSKNNSSGPVTTPPGPLTLNSVKVNGTGSGTTFKGITTSPVIQLNFSAALNPASANGAVAFTSSTGNTVNFTTTFLNHDSTLVVSITGMQPITQYLMGVSTALKSSAGAALSSSVSVKLLTAIDTTNKFPVVTDTQLLNIVEQQTFNYFYSFGHPVSGLARERNTSGDVVTTGGSGFGIMALVAGVNEQYITRAQGLARMQTIVGFLKNTAQTFHGAFPHWLNGSTGAVVPFSTEDDGADLVETSFLMEGLLTARQYFNQSSTAETQLRADINTLWNNVQWTWFQNNQNTLFWHWSPDYAWSTNMQINGWDEALMAYVLAASSNTYPITATVYNNGWAGNGSMKNGSAYYGVTLPLGPSYGGPLFFAHYSFLGMNPNGLSDAYASYATQNKAHAMINYDYCVANPNGYYGYGPNCWGLTASDVPGGYNANSPTNDLGVIAPTAAIASLPYTPAQSMQALRFFYYKLGDKMWGQYGFYDSFDLDSPWFATSDLAIDEGPIIDMIENYRSGLLWSLFMSCPEVQTGLKNLGFTGPGI
jgi:hypothetical protein